MSFNLQNCEFLKVTNKKYPILAQYTLQSKTIKEVTHAKYLGAVLGVMRYVILLLLG